MGRGSCPGTCDPWAGFYGVLSFRQVLPSQVSVRGDFSIGEALPCPEVCFLALEQGSGGAGIRSGNSCSRAPPHCAQSRAMPASISPKYLVVLGWCLDLT